MKTIGIFGTSGHASEVGDIARDLGYRPVFIASDPQDLQSRDRDEEILPEQEVGRYPDMEFTIGIGAPQIRQKIVSRFGDLNYANLIHPSATFGKNMRDAIQSRNGVVICAGVRFTNNIHVGDFTLFNLNATISHDVTIGDFVTVSPGVNVSGNVELQPACWLGAGAVINQGSAQGKLIIGANTMIGSGAVVTKSCDSDAVYAGVPARRIK